MLQIHIGKPDHPHLRHFDRCNAPIRGVNHRQQLADLRQRFVIALVLQHQPGSCSLRARQDRGHQPVPQRSREGELHPGKIIEVHAAEARAWTADSSSGQADGRANGSVPLTLELDA